MTKKWLLSLLVISLILAVPIASATAISKTLTYDSNGNLIQDVDVYYGYNSLNQLVKVREGDQNGRVLEEYRYDENGQRVKKIEYALSGLPTTTYYVDENFVRVVNSSGTFDFKYYYDTGQLIARQDSDGKKYYYHPDHLGSTNIVTDQSGNVVESTTYEPFGTILSGGQSRFTFTGKEKDDTGLVYFGARYYSSFLGKFTQPDTIIQNVYDPQSINRYAYARNNPLKYTDPTGHFIPLLAIPFIIGVIAAGINAISQIAHGADLFDGSMDWGAVGTAFIAGTAGGFAAIGGGAAAASVVGGTSGIIGGAAAGASISAASGMSALVAGQVTYNLLSGDSLPNNVFEAAVSGAVWGGAVGGLVGGVSGAGTVSSSGIGENPLYTGGRLPNTAYTYLDSGTGLKAMQQGKIAYEKPIYGSFDKYSKSSIVNSKLQVPKQNKAFRAEFPTSQFESGALKTPAVDGYLDPYTISNPQWGYGGGSQFIIEEDISNVVVRSLK